MYFEGVSTQEQLWFKTDDNHVHSIVMHRNVTHTNEILLTCAVNEAWNIRITDTDHNIYEQVKWHIIDTALDFDSIDDLLAELEELLSSFGEVVEEE